MFEETKPIDARRFTYLFQSIYFVCAFSSSSTQVLLPKLLRCKHCERNFSLFPKQWYLAGSWPLYFGIPMCFFFSLLSNQQNEGICNVWYINIYKHKSLKKWIRITRRIHSSKFCFECAQELARSHRNTPNYELWCEPCQRSACYESIGLRRRKKNQKSNTREKEREINDDGQW